MVSTKGFAIGSTSAMTKYKSTEIRKPLRAFVRSRGVRHASGKLGIGSSCSLNCVAIITQSHHLRNWVASFSFIESFLVETERPFFNYTKSASVISFAAPAGPAPAFNSIVPPGNRFVSGRHSVCVQIARQLRESTR